MSKEQDGGPAFPKRLQELFSEFAKWKDNRVSKMEKHNQALGIFKDKTEDRIKQSILDKPWKVLPAGAEYKYFLVGKEHRTTTVDMSIFTVDDERVIGCSEWMIAEPETFEYIVQLHNARLEARKQ